MNRNDQPSRHAGTRKTSSAHSLILGMMPPTHHPRDLGSCAQTIYQADSWHRIGGSSTSVRNASWPRNPSVAQSAQRQAYERLAKPNPVVIADRQFDI